MFVGIDVGRKRVKVCGNGPMIAFPSDVGDGRPLRLSTHENFVVRVNGNEYFVGDMARESYTRRSMALETKLTEETRILFLTAAAAAGVGEGATIITGVPVYQHTDADKQAFEAHLKGRYTLELNGVPRVIDITKVLIIPEGAGAYWNEVLDEIGIIKRLDLKNRPVVRVIDIGSRTVNYVTLTAGRYLDRDSGSLRYGCLELEETGATPEGFARRIVGDLSRRWADLRDTDLIMLAGGGVLAVGEYLKALFPQNQLLFCSDPVFANAGGMRKLGMAYERAHQNSPVQG